MNIAEKIDYTAACEAVALRVWGKPSQATDKELRWGTHGSRSLKRDTGQWYDHEKGEGGSTIELLKREHGWSFGQCTRWLYNEGLTGRDRTNSQPTVKVDLGKIVTRYPYYDENGFLMYQVARFEPKTFRPIRPDGSWNLKGVVRRVLYNLPALVEAVAYEKPVFVVEGEKDVDSLTRLNIVATTNPGGAGKWVAEYSDSLRGADVIVLPDNDVPGRQHADDIGAALQGIAKRVRVLALPGLAEKGDVSDWIAAGGNAENLWRLVETAPDWSKSSDVKLLANFIFVGDERPTPQKMIIEGVMPADGVSFIGGQSSAGKTFIAVLIAVCGASGKPFFGRTVNERVGTVIVAAEGKGMLGARIEAAMHEMDITEELPVAWVRQVPDFSTPKGVQAFIDQLQAISQHFKTKFGVRLGIVFVDTVSASFDIKDEADNAEAAKVCKVMRRIGESTRSTAAPIHHYGKNAGVGLRGASAWRANADFILSVTADIDGQTGDVSNRQLAIGKDRDGAQGPLTPFSLKHINLGVDDQGKPWGTMVAIAEENTPKAAATSWPDSLSVFRQALLSALNDSGFDHRPYSDGPTVRAVDIEWLRAEFYKICHVESDTEESAKAAKRKQFNRKLDDAQGKKLIGLQVAPAAPLAKATERTLIWLAQVGSR